MANDGAIRKMKHAVFKVSTSEAAATPCAKAAGGADAVGQEPKVRGHDPWRTAGAQNRHEPVSPRSTVARVGSQGVPVIGA